MAPVRIVSCLAFLGVASWVGLAHAAEPVAVVLPPAMSPRALSSTTTHLYFRGLRSGESERLWQTGGTAATTHPVWDGEGSELAAPRALTTTDEWLYFAAVAVEADAAAEALYRTDGSSVERVASVPVTRAFAGKDRVFFTVPGAGSEALWVAADAGVTDTRLTLGADAPALALGSRLLYAGRDAQAWQTDGSDAGAGQLVAANEGTALGAFAAVGAFGTFFSSNAASATLWRTDGTPAGTSPVKSWVTETGTFARDAVGFGRRIYFRARVDDAPWALWTSDGTAAGTTTLALLDETAPDAPMLGAGSAFFFVAKHGEGAALYRTSGTNASTAVVTLGAITTLTARGDHVYFPVDDEHLGGTDGTAAGTGTLSLPADVGHVEGAAGIFTVVDQNLYFTTSDEGGANARLWSLELPSRDAADAGAIAADAGTEADAASDEDGGCDCNDSKGFWSPLLGLFGLVVAQRRAARPLQKQ